MKNAPETVDAADLKKVDRNHPGFLKRRIKDLEKDNSGLRERISAKDDFYERVAAALASADPFPRRAGRASSKKSPVSVVLKLSDWHIGEVVKANETEGFNRFNWAIAQERINGIVDGVLRWTENNRALYPIDECLVLCEGDWISGDIHDELMATNEFPVPVQTAKAGTLLGEILLKIAGGFKRVNVVMVGADNHGRLRKKPQAKQKSSNNYSYLVYEIAMHYAGRAKNISYERTDGAKCLVEVNGLKILSEHGDTVRGWSGHPYYGFDRRVGKEAVRRMNTKLGFHTWSIGHFHVAGNMEDGKVIINGSLSGTSEFDHLNGRHAAPSQVAFMVHPRHGIFNFTSFRGE